MNKPLAHLLPAGEGAPYATAATRRAVYIALSGDSPKRCPVVAAERAGNLEHAIHLRRLKREHVAILLSQA